MSIVFEARKESPVPRNVILDEFRISLLVPRHLGTREGAAIRRAIRRPSFAKQLRDAAREVLAKSSQLQSVLVKISQ